MYVCKMGINICFIVEFVGTPQQKSISTDPRSPATVGVERTPLPNAPAQDNQAPWDPRSPCPGMSESYSISV